MVNLNGLTDAQKCMFTDAAVSGSILVSGLQQTRDAFRLASFGLLKNDDNTIGYQRWQITEAGRKVAGNAK